MLFVGLLSVSMSVVILSVYYNTVILTAQKIRHTIDLELETVSTHYQDGGLIRLLPVLEQRSFTSKDFIYLLFDFQGRRVDGNIYGSFEILSHKEGWVQIGYERRRSGYLSVHEGLMRVVRLKEGIVLLVGRDTEDWQGFEKVIRSALLWGGSLTIIVGFLGGFLMSRRVLRRIDAISVASRSIMEGDLSGRVPETGSGDELDRLSHHLNEMLERIEQLMNGLKNVTNNIAHDLKTPLMRLRRRAETALHEGKEDVLHYRSVLEQMILDVDGLISVFESLLLIARIESGAVHRTFSNLDVERIVRDIAELYEPVLEDLSVSLDVDIPKPLTLRANRELISQALVNLFENALKYGVTTSERHEITLFAREESHFMKIGVCDRGSGIPVDEYSNVLQPFFRLEPSRSRPGIGLGLSLASACAHLHGGRLELKDNDPGLYIALVFQKDKDVGV